MGPDAVEIWTLALAPDCVLEPLVTILRGCVENAQWAQQLLCSWMVLLPNKFGGHRTIAILCSCVRIVMKLLCSELRAWDSAFAIRGDTAAPGVKATTEIAARFLDIEISKAVGRRTAVLLWDMSHFYDGIDLPLLCADVRHSQFPPVPACVALQSSVAPRRLKISNCFSSAISSVGRSVLAGCSSSTSLARVFLSGPVRRALECDEQEAEGIGIHVDDVSQRFSGHTDREVISKALTGGSSFADAAISKGLEISHKSVVVASTISLARRIASALRARGYPIRAELRTDDLGVSLRPGRRSTHSLNKRLRLGLSRSSRALILRRAAGPRAGNLFATGSLPQATYAQAVAGLSGHQLQSVQRSARRVAGAAGMQPCSYTTVLLRLGRLPTIQMQMEQIRLWLELWKRAEDRSELARAWRATRDELAPLPLSRA